LCRGKCAWRQRVGSTLRRIKAISEEPKVIFGCLEAAGGLNMTKQTWVLIADGGHARILTTPRVAGDGNYVQLAAYDNSQALKQAQSTDRPGRAFESSDGTPHAMAEYSELQKQPKLEFAEHLAEIVNQGAANDDYARLMLVAPPTVMGKLREALSDKARGKLVGSLDKDLTHVGLADLPKHLEGVVESTVS
jgi:protein required for attachment to host cells